ncbi:unnamed protein product [Arctia plantaginis]|uniref:Uncharacterized protein n=1 Tax=Arctia plantaginis TaxID=874455 RepID=A0A8S1APS2_ARCPL|nr:unnamed protein product [Arctia plantaginis]
MATQVNPTDFLQEDEIETDFKEADFNLRDKSYSNTYPASPFRKDKMAINVIPADYLQEDKVETDLKQEVFNLQDEFNNSIRRDRLETDVDFQDPLGQDKNIPNFETYLDQTHSIRKYSFNSDTGYPESLRDVKIVTSILPTDALQRDKIQIDAIDTHSSRKIKIDSKDKAAVFLANFQKAYENGDNVYNIDHRMENKNKAAVHDVYFRTEDETVKSKTRNEIQIKRINASAKSELSTKLKVRDLCKNELALISTLSHCQ